ncbi:MAG: VIT and VWA domain-containing protein [Bryobacteraceae bacterium]
MSTAASFAPLEAATGKPLDLAMQRLWLTGQILPAGARLVAQHVFRSAEKKPIEVIYAFPLPRDASLRSFRIAGEGFEAHSELKETETAVKAYEEGIASGSLSALARQYGDGLVNLSVGNIRPGETVTVHMEILCGVELRDDGFRFRFPFTLAPSYHSQAKAAAVGEGEGEMELPAYPFGDVMLPRFREDASALHQVGFELAVVSQLGMDELGSPSHAVRVRQEGGKSARVALAAAKDVPDRDLVIDAHFASVEPQVLAGKDREGTGRFAAVIPSTSFGSIPEAQRRVVILLDRSGSMQGAPIEQAKKAIEACLAVLSEKDFFGIAAFDYRVESFRAGLVPGTRGNRDMARQFLALIAAGGGTELALGFEQATRMLAGESGDVFILTDGQVFGTEEILAKARSTGVRLHCLGIGSASQDRFLTLLARETGGVSRFVTPRERVDLAAVDLFASVGRPVASGLSGSDNIRPDPPSVVFGGAPVLIFGEGEGPVELNWEGGHMSLPVRFDTENVGETVWLLQGSRLITDWESRYPAADASTPRRTHARLVSRLHEMSRTYGLASREMSLVAVVNRKGDRAGELPQTRVVPVGMAQDTDFDAYFSLAMVQAPFAAAAPSTMEATPLLRAVEETCSMPAPPRMKVRVSRALKRMTRADSSKAKPMAGDPTDALMDLASQIESDGGMSGDIPDARASATVIALLAFLSQGHTPTQGAFRSHVLRLLDFLKSVTGLSQEHENIVHAAIELAQKGRPPAGDWLGIAQAPGSNWKEIEAALAKL